MYISSLTPTSRSSKWTLHLLHDPCPTLLWWPPSSLKHKHWKLQWSQVFFIVLLHSLTHQFFLYKYLSNPSPPPSNCLQKWVSGVTGDCELRLWRKAIQQGLQGMVPFWGLSVGLCYHKFVHSSMKEGSYKSHQPLGEIFIHLSLCLTSMPTPWHFLSSNFWGDWKEVGWHPWDRSSCFLEGMPWNTNIFTPYPLQKILLHNSLPLTSMSPIFQSCFFHVSGNQLVNTLATTYESV